MPGDFLEQSVHEGAQRLPHQAAAVEVDAFPGRLRYQRADEFSDFHPRTTDPIESACGGIRLHTDPRTAHSCPR